MVKATSFNLKGTCLIRGRSRKFKRGRSSRISSKRGPGSNHILGIGNRQNLLKKRGDPDPLDTPPHGSAIGRAICGLSLQVFGTSGINQSDPQSLTENSSGPEEVYDMHHEMLTQRAFFCHRANTKRGMLSQHFMMHVVPPLELDYWTGLLHGLTIFTFFRHPLN